jgi:hypothetical protein
MLEPGGSGTPGRPITLSAYGTGALPVIVGGDNVAGLRLQDQEHWHIEHVDVRGGKRFGIYISGSQGVLRHFRLTDLRVRDVGKGLVRGKESGLVVIGPGGPEQTFEDVVVDGVTAHDTTQWAGILVGGDDFGRQLDSPRSREVTIRNSIVHEVYGDGIILFQVNGGLIERNAAWDTGTRPVKRKGSPNAIWTWMCGGCVVQLNEGFRSDTPGKKDGGVFDIDYGSWDNVVQYNYAHDTEGYCVSVFADTFTTTNSVVRYNVCANNGLDPRLARQGSIYLFTWEGGTLDGVEIYNNTVLWQPPVDEPAVVNRAEFTGTRPNLFANNLIQSTVPSLVKTPGGLEFDHNLYWVEGDASPRWIFGDAVWNGFEDYRANTGQDSHGVYGDPYGAGGGRGDPHRALLRPGSASPALDAGRSLAEMGPRDSFGTPIPQGRGYDIGAWERLSGASVPGAAVIEAPPFVREAVRGGTHRLEDHRGRWLLLAFLAFGDREDPSSRDSRSQVVFLTSAVEQLRGDGLAVLSVALEPSGSGKAIRERLLNRSYDWNLEDIPLLHDPGAEMAHAYAVERAPTLVLISPEGRVVQRWEGFVPPADLQLTLAHAVRGASALEPRGRATPATGR